MEHSGGRQALRKHKRPETHGDQYSTPQVMKELYLQNWQKVLTFRVSESRDNGQLQYHRRSMKRPVLSGAYPEHVLGPYNSPF